MTNGIIYLATVLIWGTTWFAIKYQIGVVPPEISVVYRFAIAAALLFVWAGWRKINLRFSASDHVIMFFLGLFMYSTNFFLFYLATGHLTTGLIAVVFSTAIVWNLINGFIFLGRSVALRTLAGAGLGIAGIALVFLPELATFNLANASSLAILASVGGTFCFSMGNILSAKSQLAGKGVLATNAWAMLYGSLILSIFALARGSEFTLDMATPYLGSLLYLAVFGSVIAFGGYLTLLGRIGPDRAAYATVLFPIVALVISTAFEGFDWNLTGFLGIGLVLLGNVLIMAKPGTWKLAGCMPSFRPSSLKSR
ncbi:MAG: DMT family transporter [Geminicoccaceae bacterium]